MTVAVLSRSFSANKILRQELTQKYPQARFNDTGRTLAGDELVEFLQGCDRAIVALEAMNEQVLARLPELRVISKYGVGLDNIDLAAAARLGKKLGWTGGVNRRSVSELVICFAIALLRCVPAANRRVVEGRWGQVLGRQLSGKVVGIIGCGHIGQDVAPLFQAFGCQVLGHDIRDRSDFFRRTGVRGCGLEDLLAAADVVTLHVPLTDLTRMMIDARRLALMKPDAVLINTARGGIVDEVALKHALVNGKLAAAGFDVFAVEPPQDEELLRLPNFFATPHVGGSAVEAVLAMGRSAIAGLENAVDPMLFADHGA